MDFFLSWLLCFLCFSLSFLKVLSFFFEVLSFLKDFEDRLWFLRREKAPSVKKLPKKDAKSRSDGCPASSHTCCHHACATAFIVSVSRVLTISGDQSTKHQPRKNSTPFFKYLAFHTLIES